MAASAAFKEAIKSGQNSVKEEMKDVQAPLKDEMKAVQESVKHEMKAVQEEMKLGQESVKEEVKAVKEEITCIIENKFQAMEVRMDAVEDKVGEIQGRVSVVEQRIEGRVSALQQRIEQQIEENKPTEALQELVTDVERLSHLAFSECRTETREILSLQYFIDGIRDPEIQKALPMAGVKDIKSALVYAMKLEVAQQSTRKGHHPVRAVRVHEPVDQLMARLDDLTRQVNALQWKIGVKKPTVKCWNCVCGKSNGLSINGHIHGVPCNMIIDTGANVTIIRRDLAQTFKDKLIWTPSCVTLETASGEKIDIEGKLNVNITFGSAAYHHTAYVADITDPCTLGLDFLRKHNFSLDFKNNKLLSASEDMTINQQNGSSAGNAKVSSGRPCSESYRNHTRVEEKPKTTSNSPCQMLIGRDLRLSCDLLFDRPADAPSSPEE
ncbi:hypothetical protein X975_18466, partial [Stegodyphus mimosarum]